MKQYPGQSQSQGDSTNPKNFPEHHETTCEPTPTAPESPPHASLPQRSPGGSFLAQTKIHKKSESSCLPQAPLYKNDSGPAAP